MGLTHDQARQLLEQHGPNILPEGKKPTKLSHFLHQFTSPLIYLLVIAGIVTFLLHDYKDSIVIFAAVLINTCLGYYQEQKAEHALEALRSMTNPVTKVMRDGEVQEISVSELVPGDVVILSQGDKVPADGVLIESVSLGLNEAHLTGESTAVLRDVDGIVAMGSIVLSGRGVMKVTLTGAQTKMGAIAHELADIDDTSTPLQVRLNRLASSLALVVITLSSGICLAGLLVGMTFKEIFSTSVALAVAAIPEGMTVSLTVILAIGMQRILKKKALVRRLMAAESLGSVTVIATDKTGTLTEGLMRVTHEFINNQNAALSIAVYANNLDDPLEIALWEWAQTKKPDIDKMAESVVREAEVSFSSEHKYMSVTIEKHVYLKGAPEIVLDMCDVSEQVKAESLKRINDLSDKGLRLIGLAHGKSMTSLTWVGMLAMDDPVRKNITEVMNTCHGAGIRTLMITGDYAGTARAVWSQVLQKELHEITIIDGKELEKISDKGLREHVVITDIFARVSPHQKLRIVKALQQNGEVVALIGDGVNDAPALKEANIGIVVGSASDVAKETADMVLLDSNFRTIISAIEEGRSMYSNIRKVIRYLLSGAFAEIILVMGSIVAGLPVALTAAQILWINIISDSLPAMALSVEPKDKNLLKKRPVDPSQSFIDFEMKWMIGIISGISGILSLFLFMHYFYAEGILKAQTVTFTALSLGTLAYVFSIRSMSSPVFSDKKQVNIPLYAAVGVGVILQICALYIGDLQTFLNTTPLLFSDWLMIALFAVLLIVLVEFSKLMFSRLHAHYR